MDLVLEIVRIASQRIFSTVLSISLLSWMVMHANSEPVTHHRMSVGERCVKWLTSIFHNVFKARSA